MNNWDISILVNGNRCKQYQHQGKTFIEAKQGSEYSIEIRNNYWKRILAVSAVDSLNVLTGKTATEQDTGYIIDAYHSEKIKGFRFSDDEWAMFKFGYKYNGKTYAQSKNDGSEQNCGVVGIRLFYEQDPIVIYNNSPLFTTNPTDWPSWVTPSTPTCGDMSYTSDVKFMAPTSCQDLSFGNALDSDADDSQICASNNLLRSDGGQRKMSAKGKITAQNCSSPTPKGFDMGTEWGRKEHSKVNTVNFEKGCLALSLDIYYASRESLIEMGVPLTNELKINLPQSFPEKYAQPPKHWVG